MSLDDQQVFGSPIRITAVSGLRRPDLVASEAVQLAAGGEPHAARQHVVSRVLLKGFSEPGPKGTEVGCFRKADGQTHANAIKSAGKVDNFICFASGSAELRWQTVENRLSTP
jgi:hypothetical protein